MTPERKTCRIAATVILYFCVWIAGPVARAQEPAESAASDVQVSEERIRQAFEEQQAENRSAGGSTPSVDRASIPFESLDAESREALLERYRRLQQHHVTMLEHREDVLRWQLTANQISFWMVLVLVFTGLVFAGIQFRTAMQSTKASGEDTEAMQEVSLGAEGVTIRSSVLGVIILALSLAFFYLYLVYVFPVEELGRDADARAGASVEKPAEAPAAAGDTP